MWKTERLFSISNPGEHFTAHWAQLGLSKGPLPIQGPQRAPLICPDTRLSSAKYVQGTTLSSPIRQMETATSEVFPYTSRQADLTTALEHCFPHLQKGKAGETLRSSEGTTAPSGTHTRQHFPEEADSGSRSSARARRAQRSLFVPHPPVTLPCFALVFNVQIQEVEVSELSLTSDPPKRKECPPLLWNHLK